MVQSPPPRLIRAFLVLAEELHFGRAAARLGMAQPHLSTTIRRLEEMIGASLFVRAPRVALTPAGTVLLDGASRALRELDHSVERARLATHAAASRCVVGITSSALLTVAARALRMHCTAHPRVEVRLRELHSAELPVAVARGTVDVGVMRASGGPGAGSPTLDPELACRVLWREPFMALLPSGHPLAKGREVPPAALAGEPLILFVRHVAPALHDQIVSICSRAGFTPRIEHEVTEWHSVAALVAGGLGVAIAPRSVATLRWPGLTCRSLHEVPASSALVGVWRRADGSGRVAPILDALVTAFEATGTGDQSQPARHPRKSAR